MNESSTLSQFLEVETVCASAWKVEEYDGYRTDSFAESQIPKIRKQSQWQSQLQ